MILVMFDISMKAKQNILYEQGAQAHKLHKNYKPLDRERKGFQFFSGI